MKLRKYILTVMIGITAMTVLSSCANKENAVKGQPDQSTQEIFAMDTYMSLTAYGSNSEEAVSKAVQEINRLDAMFSVGNEDSDVTKINENGSGEVSEETAFIMNRAMQVSEKLMGLSILRYILLWSCGDLRQRITECQKAVRLQRHLRVFLIPMYQ